MSSIGRRLHTKSGNTEPGGPLELRYLVRQASDFARESSFGFANDFGVFEMVGGSLRVTISEPSAPDAVTRVEHFLRAWEFQAELQHGIPVLQFVRPDDMLSDEGVAARIPAEARADQKIVIEWSSCPEPPSIKFIPELYAAWSRFRRARMGIGEPVQSAAYHLLTVVEGLGGGRSDAANRFGVNVAILRKIGELSSAWNNPHPRKSVGEHAPQLTERHERWLETAIRAVLLQVGVQMSGANPPKLGMGDLPDFPAPV